MKVLAGFLAALAPGLLSLWWGRSLIRHEGAADLPERLWRNRRQMASVTVWALILGVWLGGVWMLAVVVIGIMVGSFPARRKLLQETWSLGQYAVFQLRVYLGFSGFWLALAVTPTLIAWLPEAWMWPGAGLAAGLLWLLSKYFAQLFPRILGAEPLEGEALAPFEPYFEPVLERTTASRPTVWWVRMGGGRFANAVALPALERPGVLFWETLLTLFEPREVGAVFAHEVAHLEQFNPQYLRRRSYLGWILILGAVSCVPLTQQLAPEFTPWVPLLWLLVILMGAMMRNQNARQHETPADLRALELCGDAEALISALEKLHTVLLLPRRLAVAEENRTTHPSLARRLAAIRRAAQMDASHPEVPLFLTLLHPGDGRRVVFESRRVSWLEGVPEGLEEEPPEALIAAATRVTTLAYERLTELHLGMRRGRHRLRAADAAGRSWEVFVPAEEVAAVQAALDAVDQHLATPERSALSPVDLLIRSLCRVGALGGTIAALLFPLLSMIVAGVLAAFWPRAAILAGYAAAALGGVVFQLFVGRLDEPARLLAMLLLGLTGLLAAYGSRRSWRTLPGERSRGALAGGLVLAVCGSLALAGGSLWMLWEGEFDALHLHQMTRILPGIGLLFLAAGVTLAFARGRHRRWVQRGTGLCLFLGLLPLAISSPLFERTLIRDPLLVPRSVARPPAEDWQPVAAVNLGARWPSTLVLSPSGERFAVLVHPRPDLEEESNLGAPVWQLGDFANGIGVHSVDGQDLLFLDEDTLLVLQEVEKPGSRAEDGLGLRQLNFEDPQTPRWTVEVPSLATPRLTVVDDRWFVEGQPAAGRYAGGYVRYQGYLSETAEAAEAAQVAGVAEAADVSPRNPTGDPEAAFETRLWTLPEQSYSGYGTWTTGVGDWALALSVADPFDDGSASLWTYWLSGSRWDLWSVPIASEASGEARHRLASQLSVNCFSAPTTDVALCVGDQGDAAHLWRIPLAPGAPPVPLARLEGVSYVEVRWDARGAMLHAFDGGLWRVENSGAIFAIRFAPDDHLLHAVMTSAGELAVLESQGSSSQIRRLAPGSAAAAH